MMVRKVKEGHAWVRDFWKDYRTVSVILIVVGIILLVFFLWLFGVFGSRTSTTGATQLAPGVDEQTITQVIHAQSVKEFAPVNKRLDALEAGQKSLNADVSSIKSDVQQLRGGQAAIQSRKLDGNLMMKMLDELDKKEPPTKPVSRLEGDGGNFLPSPV